MRFSLLRKLFGRKTQPLLRRPPVRIRPQLEYLEDRTLLSVTWGVQSDFFGTRDGVSEPRSLRGLALSADNQNLYGGFIQGTTSAAIREVSAGVNTSLIGNDGGSPTNSYGSNPPYTTGLEAKVTTYDQAKGLATDDRGNVFATLNSGTDSTNQYWTIYNSSLTAQVATELSTNYTSTSQLSGIATAKIGGHYFVYVGWKNGQIERWNVDNAAAPVLDTSFGNAAAHPGTISLKTLNVNAYLDGLTVDTNGDIYVAGGLQGTTSYGDSLIKITAAQATNGNLASATHVDVKGGADGSGGYAAMDVALFNGQAYVTEYLGADSTIALFNTSDLSSAGILTPDNLTGPSGLDATFPTGADSGFSDIDISADGKIYVAEQLYNYVSSADSYTPPGGTPMTGTRIYFDRVMVSSAQGVAPIITSADNTTFTVGTPGTFTVTTTGVPAPSLSESGALPSGVTFVDNGDGTATLSGTPAAGTGGVYSFTITASNGTLPKAMQTFTLTDDEAPSITSANSTTFAVGTPGSFTVTTGHSYPANPTLSETGTLPSGVTFVDNGDGTATLSGTPLPGTAGTYSFTITASNGVSPDAMQPFTLVVAPIGNSTILLLDASGKDSLSATSTGQVTDIGGSIIVDSNNAEAAVVSQSGYIGAANLFVTGGAVTKPYGTIAANIVTQPPTADPLASLPPPAPPATTFTNKTITGGTVTLYPGTYVGGITISGSAHVTFAPGVYYLKNGGLKVSGTATVVTGAGSDPVTGNGVLIYQASAYTVFGSPIGGINISGQASVDLIAPTLGTYQGISIFEDRNFTAPITISVNSYLTLHGTLYAAKAAVNLSGGHLTLLSNSPSDPANLIVADLHANGTGVVTVEPNPV